MAQIKNLTKYPIKQTPKPNDYFVGSDTDRNGATVSFEIASIISTIRGAGEQNRIVSGAPIWIPNTLSYQIPVITYFLSGTLYNTTPTTVTLDHGGALPRIDVIAVTSTSTVVVFKGTESSSPTKPTFPNSTDYLELTFVNVAAGATVPTNTTAAKIYDDGVGPPAEFTATENTGGNGITLRYYNPDVANTGTTVIKTLRGSLANGTISFTTNTPQIFNANDHIQLSLAKHEIFTPDMKFEMSLYYLGNEVTSKLTINSTLFGFDNNIMDDYQTLIIPFFSFVPPISFYDRIDIKITNIPYSDVYLDTLYLISGVVLPPPMVTEIPVKTSQLINDGEDGVSPFSTLQDINNAISAIPPVPDATTAVKGKVKLAGDLAGTADSPTVPALAIKANDSTVLHNTGNEIKSGNLTVNAIIKSGGASTQFLKADGSVDSTTYQTNLGYTPENIANKGINNGYASLDSGGKVPITQLPNSIMEYKGVYNASTNTPTLVDGTGNTGDTYKVTVAGSGVNGLNFVVGDYAVYNGTTWEKAHSGADAVNSVFGRTGIVTAQNNDYTTALVPDTTNKRYQTDAQQANNDATSSIQTQLNNRELLANKQNSLAYDGTGVKYSTVDAVNNLSRNIAEVATKTGLLTKNDAFNLIALTNNTLRIAQVDSAMFWNELFTAGTAPSAAIRTFAQKDYALTDLVTPTGGNVNINPLTTDGKYIRYMGYDKNGNVYSSATNFVTNNDVLQLGFITVLKVGASVTFLDGTAGPRNVLAQPNMAYNTDFDKVTATVTNISVTTNAAASLATSNGNITGISVNWKSSANPSNSNPIDVFNYTGVNPVPFRNIDPLFLSSTATLSTHTLWTDTENSIAINSKFFNTTTQASGTMANGTAAVKRILVGIRGSIYVQDGEFSSTACYSDLATAKNNIFNHKFSDAITPLGTAFEIARVAYIKGAINFSDTTQFYLVNTAGSSSGGSSTIAPVSDATTVSKGIIKLAGDFDPTSTADVPVILNASATSRGVVTTAAQTFAGNKTITLTTKPRKDVTGTTYTLLNTDNAFTLYFTNASGCTLTVPSGLPTTQEYDLIQYSTGQVSLVTSGTTFRLQDYEIATTYGIYSRVIISWLDTEAYQLIGELSML